jgi:26S proteasome regulatory subunit (ATPase 3-interacting protein)
MMTDQEAKKAISEYMIKMNRPFSVQNIIDNMQGRVKKTSAQTILDKLSDEGVLKCKEYGKAKIYLANQDNFPEVSNEELA